MRKSWGFGLVLAVAAILAPPQAWAGDVAGSVLTFSGQCLVERDGRPTALALGDSVDVGDTILVPTGARLKLRMSDGSVISAGSGSHLTLTAYTPGDGAQHRNVRIDLAGGLLRAVVAAVAQPQHFEVDTATGVAAVRSTDWFVEASPDLTRVGVLKGVVTLTSNATHKQFPIPARWGAKVRKGLDPTPPRLWAASEFADVIARTDVK
jgi:hypothetical protein